MRKMNVTRKTFTLADKHINHIREYSDLTGTSESEFIRRLVEQHMRTQQNNILIRDGEEVKAYEK